MIKRIIAFIIRYIRRQEAERKRQEAYEDYLASLEKELKTLLIAQAAVLRLVFQPCKYRCRLVSHFYSPCSSATGIYTIFNGIIFRYFSLNLS